MADKQSDRLVIVPSPRSLPNAALSLGFRVTPFCHHCHRDGGAGRPGNAGRAFPDGAAASDRHHPLLALKQPAARARAEQSDRRAEQERLRADRLAVPFRAQGNPDATD